MGLEASTFISGLNSIWPLPGDTKSQGDDHIRLLKAVLQATFPTANRAFYFPTASAQLAAPTTIAASDQNKIIQFNTSGGDVTATLPALTTTDAGWECQVIKISSDTNGVMVSPPSGTIGSQVGQTSTIRVGQFVKPARFIWTGTQWLCVKPYLIGQSINWDGGSVPAGYLTQDGSTFSATTFAELNAVFGGNVLRDKRGRVEAGVDGGTGRLNGYTGVGVAGGADTVALNASQIPTITTNVSVSGSLAGATDSNVLFSTITDFLAAGGNPILKPGNTGARINVTVSGTLNGSGTSNNTGGGAHTNVQPTIAVSKITCAC